MSLKTLILLGGAIATLSAVHAQAAVLYTSGPVDGTISGTMIIDPILVTNSFTLGTAATITGFSFGALSLGGIVTGTDFGFSPTMDFVLTGTALSVTHSAVLTTLNISGFSFAVREYTATIAPVTLAAGTYWFTLGNAVTDTGAPAFWDQNAGAGAAFAVGGLNPVTASRVNSFTLTGNAVPEPATWALMLMGFGLVGSAMRRGRMVVRFA